MEKRVERRERKGEKRGEVGGRRWEEEEGWRGVRGV